MDVLDKERSQLQTVGKLQGLEEIGQMILHCCFR
jgi:hypothetical protein